MFKPCVIVPCYNHAKLFEKVARNLSVLNYPVIVVNDGSCCNETDILCDICNRFGFEIINLSQNRGKGFAMKKGLSFAKNAGYTHALQIDADGQHCIGDIKSFLDMAKKNPNCIINGVPVYDDSAPKARMYGRKITNFWVWVETCGVKIEDAMCGFRVYPLYEVEKIVRNLYFYRMGFDIEILVKSVIAGIGCIDVKTKVIYPNNGMSHFKMVRDNVKISCLHCYLCFYSVWKFICKLWRNL